MSGTAITIEFEDKGQGFLCWRLDKEGHIIASEPSQTEFWRGLRVFPSSLQTCLKKGRPPMIYSPRGKRKLHYKIIAIHYHVPRREIREAQQPRPPANRKQGVTA